MSLLQVPSQAPQGRIGSHDGRLWWRLAVLSGLLLLSIINYVFLSRVAPPNNPISAADSLINIPFLQLWLVAFLPYFMACAYVLATPPSTGRWLKAELGIILLGAALLRIMLLPIPPVLSRDSWRYLWDARVALSGFSPYVFRPVDPALHSLVDNVLFPNMRFRTAPTIYPPGAQAVFLLSYLAAQSNLFFLKGIFVGFDMITCIALMVLLKRKGVDQRRALLYAWCPLPIVEFAVNGHVDVITLTITLLAWLTADNTSLRGRVLTGFLIGFSALTKIYPILLLAVIVPELLHEARGDDRNVFSRMQGSSYALVLTCLLTVALGYLPYLILGHGQVLGYFSTYANEQGQNAGVINLAIQWLGSQLHLDLPTVLVLEHIIEVLSICAASLVVFALRLRDRISREMASLIIFGVILAISSHVFPWYTTILLLWLPALFTPIWSRRGSEAKGGKGILSSLSGKGLAIVATWYFTCASLLSYFPAQGGQSALASWTTYYQFVYKPLVVALGLAAIIGVMNRFWLRKEVSHANHR